jgi:hypothetical protein
VKQAPFRVLIGATMPAALVEVGFISNPEEEAKLKSAEHQDRLVVAIVAAVERFKADYEAKLGVTPAALAPSATTPSQPAAPAPATPPPPATNEKAGR